MSIYDKDVMPRDSVITMIAEVRTAQAEVAQAFKLMESAKHRLKLALGEHRDNLWEGNFSGYNMEREAKDSAAIIKRNAWKSIVARLQVREIVSVKKREEIDRQLDDGKLPELTEQNVRSFIDQLHRDIGSLLEDSAREVFDWLRPTNNWKQLKTNNKNVYGLTDKVIMTWGMDSEYDKSMPRRVSYHSEKYFRALDNVFHLLDGKGVSKYPTDLCTTISTAGRAGKCETPYFACKWFKNGNIHIQFLRMDLVEKLNVMAGSDKLRPSA